MTQHTTGAPSFGDWSGGGYELTEEARWHDGHLVFTDILAGTLLAAPGAGPGEARSLARLNMRWCRGPGRRPARRVDRRGRDWDRADRPGYHTGLA